MQFIQVRRFPLTQLQTAAQGFPCEYLKIGHIDWDFLLTVAHIEVRGFSHLAIALRCRERRRKIFSSPCVIECVHNPIAKYFSRRRSLLRLKIASDQPRAFIERKIGPSPLKKDEQAIPKTDQKNDMHKQPRHPRGKTA